MVELRNNTKLVDRKKNTEGKLVFSSQTNGRLSFFLMKIMTNNRVGEEMKVIDCFCKKKVDCKIVNFLIIHA